MSQNRRSLPITDSSHHRNPASQKIALCNFFATYLPVEVSSTTFRNAFAFVILGGSQLSGVRRWEEGVRGSS
jgi:hypothetical protein